MDSDCRLETLSRLGAERGLQDGALRRDGLSLRLPEHRAEMTPEDAVLWRRVEPLIAEGGIRPPRVRELAADLDLEVEATEGFLGRAARLARQAQSWS